MPDKEILPVVQGDRDAAANYIAAVSLAKGQYDPVAMVFMDECCDEMPIVQAFARHRERTIEECAKIAEAHADGWGGPEQATAFSIAEDIRSLASPPSVEDKA